MYEQRSSHCGTAETNPTRNPEVAGLIPGLTQWVKLAAPAPIQSLAWELPYATCHRFGPKKQKKKKKRERERLNTLTIKWKI